MVCAIIVSTIIGESMVYNISVGGIAIQLKLLNKSNVLAITPFITTRKPEYYISFEFAHSLEPLLEQPLFTMSNEHVYDQGNYRVIDESSYRIIIDKQIKSYKVLILKHQTNDLDELEYVISEKIITEISALRHQFLLHGSAIVYNNKAIICSGHTQTGKTTLTKAWIKEHPESKYINDDKPLFSIEQEKIYISSHPWAGTEGLAKDIKAELETIIFVKKGIVNQVIEIDNHQKIGLLMEHFKKSIDSNVTKNLLDMIDKIIKNHKIIIYQHANDQNSIKTLYDYLNKNHFN